jgi:hypothetical protein
MRRKGERKRWKNKPKLQLRLPSEFDDKEGWRRYSTQATPTFTIPTPTCAIGSSRRFLFSNSCV